MTKVILPACNIPKGSKVTKIKGTVIYTILDRVPIYGYKGIVKIEIDPEANLRFLTNGEYIVAVDGNTELVWHVDDETLINYLSDEV